MSIDFPASWPSIARHRVPCLCARSSASVGTSGSEGWTLARHQELVRTIRSQIGVAENWTPPRTVWGEPDLQGSWTSDSVHGVPRERPEHFGTRAFLNDEEYAERVGREEKTRESAFNASGPTPTGATDVGGKTTFRIASMILTPEWKIPVTPEAQNRRSFADLGVAA